MKKMKKPLSFILVVALVVSMFATFSLVGEAYTTPGKVDEATVKSRLDSLYNTLNLKYFTVNQSACGYWLSDHGCDNCYNQNVIGQTWFKNLFGNVDIEQFPIHYTPSNYITRKCWSCAGFATFAEWYLFKTNQTDAVSTYKVGSGSFNYSYVSANAKVGDIARLDNSHSVIIYSIGSSGIYVLDCNTRPSGDGSNCRVRKSYWSYGSYSTITISRATNYSATPVLPPAPKLTVTPTTTTDDKEISLSWNACSGATSYSIMYSYNGSSNQYYKTGITSTSYKMSFSKPGTYVVYVDSVNSAGTNPSNKVTVTVGKSVKSISVETLPDKTEYVLDDDFDSTGLTLKLVYSDGTSDIVDSGFTCSGFDSSSSGTKEITVSYGGKTATFNVEVLDDLGELLSVEVSSLPNKTEYTIGEKFESDGLILSAKYSKGYTRKIKTGYTVSGFESATVGKKTVTVSFDGKQTSFSVYVFLKRDWSEWIRVEDLPDEIKNATSGMYEFEYADGYRMREKQTVTNGYSSLDGWTLDSKTKTGTTYGVWQLNRPATSDRQGATEQTVVSVETKNVYDNFAWVNSAHNYFWKAATEAMYTNEIHIYSSAHNFTVDSDNSYVCQATISASNPGGFGQVFLMTDNGSVISSFSSTASNGKSYFWANGTRDIYRTVTDKYQYTYSRWGAWSDYSVNPITATETREVETLKNGYVRYRVSPEQIKVVGVSVETLPEKTEYLLDEAFDASGLTLRVNYSDGSSDIVNEGFVLSGFNSASSGTKTVTVSYNGVKTTFTVTVSAKSEWSSWIRSDELPDFVKNSDKYEIEYANGYRTREKQTVTNGYSSLDGWTLDSKTKTGTTYGAWQLNRPATSDKQGATEQTVVSVETKNVYDNFAWVNSAHNYFWKAVTDSMYTNEIHIYSSAHNFTVDSDNAYVCQKTISASNPGGFGQVFLMTDNGSVISSFSSTASNGASYFWSNGTRDIYRTVTDKYQYTYSKWGDWSELSMTPAEASSTVEVETVNNGFVRYRAVEQESLPDFKVASASLSLSETIAINFRVSTAVKEAYENLYAIVTCDGDEQRIEGVVESDGRVRFTYSNLTPNMAKVPVSFTLYGTANGQQYTKNIEYSVYKYCTGQYNRTTDAAYKTFLTDFINYAAALQLYTEYRTDDLANADFDQTYASTELAAPVSQLNSKLVQIDNPSVKWSGVTLAIRDTVNVRLKFTAADVSNLTVRFVINGVTIEKTDFTPVEGADNQYYVYFGDILPKEMRTPFTATVYADGVAVSNTLQYSIQSYAVGKTTAGTALNDLVIAMLKFGDSCAAYFG